MLTLPVSNFASIRRGGMNQNVNHVDHVVWVAEPDNHQRFVDKLSALFDIEFEGPFERTDAGITVSVSWGGGVEVVSPAGPGPFAERARDHLENRGESVFAVVFGVPEIEKARARAESLGYQTSPLVENLGGEPWDHQLLSFKESAIGEFAGTLLMFGEITYCDGVFRTRP
jgi:hypothetical protein